MFFFSIYLIFDGNNTTIHSMSTNSGDRKQSKTLSQMRGGGGVQDHGTSYNFNKVCTGRSFWKKYSSSEMLFILRKVQTVYINSK